MNLQDILYKVSIDKVVGSTDIEISNIAFDSRKVNANGLFVAINGTISDGHQFIDSAIEKGAIAIIVEQIPANINAAEALKSLDITSAPIKFVFPSIFALLFLIEILANISSPDVIVELSDPSRAGILLPMEKENDDEDVLMLLMPMMINV